jgi:hypothetical protein
MKDLRPNVQLKRLEILSNQGQSVEISNGFAQLYYYESILENSVKADLTYADTGGRNYPGETTSSTEIGDLNLQYAERIFLDIEDEEKGRVQFITPETCLHFITRPKIIGNTRSEIISANLASKEYLTNQFEDNRVSRTYEGKISETVTKILLQHLKTPKTLFIEDTLNNLKIDGRIDNSSNPFEILRQLSKKSVPIIASKTTEGYTAGYFFFETSDGYHFKSIDNLLAQTPMRKYIMNNTTELPFGYDAKILKYEFKEGPSIVDQMKAGTYNSTRITFNPVTHEYKRETINVRQQDKGSVRAEKSLPFIPDELNYSTKTAFSTLDIGQLPYGVSLEEQVQYSDQENLKVREILNQSMMRYNQLFSLPLTITVFCDVTLHAGDMIECTFPEVSSKQTQMMSKKKSGKYLISDLCHFISPVGPNYTKMILVRDSYGG